MGTAGGRGTDREAPIREAPTGHRAKPCNPSGTDAARTPAPPPPRPWASGATADRSVRGAAHRRDRAPRRWPGRRPLPRKILTPRGADPMQLSQDTPHSRIATFAPTGDSHPAGGSRLSVSRTGTWAGSSTGRRRSAHTTRTAKSSNQPSVQRDVASRALSPYPSHRRRVPRGGPAPRPRTPRAGLVSGSAPNSTPVRGPGPPAAAGVRPLSLWLPGCPRSSWSAAVSVSNRCRLSRRVSVGA